MNKKNPPPIIEQYNYGFTRSEEVYFNSIPSDFLENYSLDHSAVTILYKRLITLGVSHESCRRALKNAKKLGTSIVDELISYEIISAERYYTKIAQELEIPYVSSIDAATLLLDPVFDGKNCGNILQIMGKSPHSLPILYIAPNLNMEMGLRYLIEGDKKEKKRIRICTPSTIIESVNKKRSQKCLNWAVNGLELKLSAKQVCTPQQSYILGVLCTLIPICFYTYFSFFSTLTHIIFAALFSFVIAIRLVAIKQLKKRTVADLDFPPGIYPKYSVLIAVYKEKDIADQLVKAMSLLDWPRSRLQILYVCEEQDEETINALLKCSLPVNHGIIRVPESVPKTKPKALNYALQMCNGDFVVIYDAEDRPHPFQLKEAWANFYKSPENLACLQAPLVVTNASRSWLARMFAFEYSSHFTGLLPFFAESNIPFPLGGTSNHFKRSALETVGGWDAFNVTEDADLGIRLYRFGFTSGILNLPTLEDGPEHLKEWLPQRTRWQKGWMQTFIVQNRRMIHLFKVMGFKKTSYFEVLLIGFIISPLLYIPSILMTINSLYWFDSNHPFLVLFDLFLLFMGYFCAVAMGFGCKKYSLKKKVIIAITLPFYWFLLSIAAWRAIYQLIVNPHFWEKTPHRPTVNINDNHFST